MKSFLAVCWSLTALFAANAAAAGPFQQEMRFPLLAQAQSPRPEPQREGARPEPQRDRRAAGEADRGRMNSDERRQLRRDIQDAGKDIYPPAQQGRGDGRQPGRR